tara:strand:- start:535 stop:2070 length:1536 start_codon:yes stop_codon:yes gene_type:complete
VYRIFGPPGTGKTTSLLNKVDDALQRGTQPNRIAFLAFTRKAAEEARERAAERFKLDPKKDLMYFRTLHSLALTLSDISTDQVMQTENYLELSRGMGVQLSVGRSPSFNDDLPDILKANDPILAIINLARIRKVDLRQQYNSSQMEIEWNIVNHVDKSLKNYKKNMCMFDFTDMLEKFVTESHNWCPTFDLCFVDEAQDLSPMQWDIAHLLDQKSDRMYIAGDDDQAIYRWAGADVDTFINLDGPSETLTQSYRIPFKVHQLAERVVKRINRRVVKAYEPKNDEGSVQYRTSVDDIDLSDGSWLILAQAAYQLQPIADSLRSFGYLFSFRGSRSISEKISDAVNGWEQLRKGEKVTGKTARNIYSYMSAKETMRSSQHVAKGFKTIPGLEDADLVNIQDLFVNHGLLASAEHIWHEAMDKIPERERAYLIALLRRGEKFNGDPRIVVSTIHGSKGGEADNVIVFSDLTPAADKQMRDDPDDIHRVFYVAVTRAKENLFIIDAEDATRSYYL